MSNKDKLMTFVFVVLISVGIWDGLQTWGAKYFLIIMLPSLFTSFILPNSSKDKFISNLLISTALFCVLGLGYHYGILG